MAITANGTPTDDWSLITSATGNTTVSVSCTKYDLELVNHNSGSTPPAADLRGHPVVRGRIEPVTLKSGDHLWQRIAPTKDVGTSDDTPKIVYTVQT